MPPLEDETVRALIVRLLAEYEVDNAITWSRTASESLQGIFGGRVRQRAIGKALWQYVKNGCRINVSHETIPEYQEHGDRKYEIKLKFGGKQLYLYFYLSERQRERRIHIGQLKLDDSR